MENFITNAWQLHTKPRKLYNRILKPKIHKARTFHHHLPVQNLPHISTSVENHTITPAYNKKLILDNLKKNNKRQTSNHPPKSLYPRQLIPPLPTEVRIIWLSLKFRTKHFCRTSSNSENTSSSSTNGRLPSTSNTRSASINFSANTLDLTSPLLADPSAFTPLNTNS